MWNKDKREYTPDTPGVQPTQPHVQPQVEPRAERADRRPEAPRSSGPAMIGRSISIRGEVTGDEDMVIQGRVEGSVDLKQHSVTVGPEGEVKANIIARIVTVEGRVVGNLSGEEQVVLRASARVDGDIVSPRVVLEDGTIFRGSVEMGEVAARAHRGAAQAAQATQAAPAARVERPSEPQAKPVEADKRPAAAPTPDPAKKPATAGVGQVKG